MSASVHTEPLFSSVHTPTLAHQQLSQPPFVLPANLHSASSTLSPPSSSLFADDVLFDDSVLLPSATSAAATRPVSDDDSSSSSGSSFSSPFSLPDWQAPATQPPHTAVVPSVVPSSSSAGHSAARVAPTSSSETVGHRRKRKPTLSAQERLQRRRAQHRAVDASRRQRELEAIARLRSLIQQQQQQEEDEAVEKEQDNETDEGEGEHEAAGETRKKGRLTVLESSVALIEHLTAVCQRMESVCSAQSAQLSRVSSQLHTVAATIARVAVSTCAAAAPASSATTATPVAATDMNFDTVPSASSTFRSLVLDSVISHLERADRSRSLCQSSVNMLSSLCISVISVPLGVVVDMNDNFLRTMRARRTDLLYRPIDLVSLDKKVSQYPAALAETEAVMRGVKRRSQAVWRCRMWDGVKFEVACTFWSDYDVPPGSGLLGSEPRIPDRLVTVYAPEDVVLLEDSPIADTLLCT